MVLLGRQGSGKGTQADRLALLFGVTHISTGDAFRAAVDSGTPLGKTAKAYMDSGELVPDEVVIDVIRERLVGLGALGRDAHAGFVLDGFPRNLAQAEALDTMLSSIGRELDAVLFLNLSDEVAIERLRRRAEVEGRADDTPEVIARRLAIYHDDTEPIVEHYRVAGTLVPLQAELTIDEVWAQIEAALEVVAS
jgi:adenylate kinase